MCKNRNKTPHEMLAAIGATLLRTGKHEIWLLPNRKTVTLSKTASDFRAYRNQKADIKRQLRATL